MSCAARAVNNNQRGRHAGFSAKLGAAYAADVLLHEMVHVALLAADAGGDHNSVEWRAEIVRITPHCRLP